MQYQRVTGQHVGDLLQTGEIQFRFAFKFVGAVAGADGNGQAVAAGTFHKFYGLIRIRVGGVFGSNFNGVFHAGQFAQFRFYDHAFAVGIIYHTFGQFNVFFKRILGTVDHNGSEAAVHAVFADFKISAVIQMQADGKTGVFYCRFHQLGQINMLGIFAGAGGNLQDQRSLFLYGGFHDTLDDLHVVNIERTNSIVPFIGFFEHFFCVN